MRLVELELKHKDDEVVEREAAILIDKLITFNTDHSLGLYIWGPAKPPCTK